MRVHNTACLGIFAVMALSNAIVPVLPAYADTSTLQGTIYSAYFLGAFLLTLPGGLFSDRYGPVKVIQSGLIITIISGLILFIASDPFVTIGARFLEGIGAGLFVAASMSVVNALPDHEKMSGYFMASLNAGLVMGLIFGGILALYTSMPSSGVLLFTGLCILSALPGISPVNNARANQIQHNRIALPALLYDYRWFWYSAVILVGATGVVTSLYPAFSATSSDVTGLWISGMSIATIIAVLIVSKMNLPPVPTIRIAALFMAGGVLLSYYSPAGFLVIGALAGIIMIAQMAFLAGAGKEQQGAVMGMFSATSYLGMSLLSFLAGIIADATTFILAYCATACAALSVAVTIGWCSCRKPDHSLTGEPVLE